MNTRVHLELEIDEDGTITITSQQVVRSRKTVTPERLDQVRKLNEMGGAEMVAAALSINRSQAYRLIEKTR